MDPEQREPTAADRIEAERRTPLFLAVSNPATHPALLSTHLATTFSAATTGHAFSSTGVDVSTIWDWTIAGDA
jgi:hypothetical protein